MVRLAQNLNLQLKKSPQQVLLSSLLQLPVLSLEQRIRLELETNPLLELDIEEEMEQIQEEIEPKDDADEEPEEEKEIDWEEILNDEESFEVKIPKERNTEKASKIAQSMVVPELDLLARKLPTKELKTFASELKVVLEDKNKKPKDLADLIVMKKRSFKL